MAKIILTDDEKKFIINDVQERLAKFEGKKVSKTKLNDALVRYLVAEGYWISDNAIYRFEDWCKNNENL